MTITVEKQPELTCPKRKKHQLLIRDKVVKCHNEACNWFQFRYLWRAFEPGRNSKNKTPVIKGTKSKSGKQFNAFIVVNDAEETSFEFDKTAYKKE